MYVSKDASLQILCCTKMKYYYFICYTENNCCDFVCNFLHYGNYGRIEKNCIFSMDFSRIVGMHYLPA